MRSNYIQTKRKKINSNKFQQQLIRVILVVGSIILLIIFFFGDHGLYQLYQLRTEKAKIQDAISSLRIKKQVLEEEKTILNSDAKYIEQLARERFRMAKKGEKVFKVIEKDSK